MSIRKNPFGQTITTNTIIDTLGFFDSWEDRYRYIIDLGKELPEMDAAKKSGRNIVRGCQSQVWIDYKVNDNIFWFEVDSDAFVVKGLLGIVLAAYNGKSAEYIRNFDIETYFNTLGLLKHLSATRGNGLQAMVKNIQGLAGLPRVC